MRTWTVLAVLLLVGACAEGPLDPAAALLEGGSGGGLEQLLDVRTTAQDGFVNFTITSTLRNSSDESITLRVRSCYIRTADVRGDVAGLRLHEPLMLCASDHHDIVLEPGETSETLEISGTMEPGASHDLELRHMLMPERWAAVTLTAP